ncbi:MAG: ABC transporter substrate-binding protein, partial [Thermomicrobiales bacterium]|nr:ABC transporter substrate-binding protein [Thermomicrobiales bacterium]
EGPTQYPLTIENCGDEVVFDAAPERVLTLAPNTTEILLALGLADHMAGMIGAKDQLLPELQAAAEPVEVITESAFPYPSREVVLAADPDLLLSGYGGDFTEGAYGTRESYAELEIQSMYLTDACESDGGVTLDTTYQDILTLGRIFDVPQAAADLVNQMQADAASVQPADPPVSVFVFGGDAVEENITIGGGGLLDDMITRAGGSNIFADLPNSGHNNSVSMEDIVARNPEVIVIIHYRALPAEEIIAYMKADPSWSQVSAVQNDRFVIIDVTSTVPGVRNGRAIAELSAGFAGGA